MNTPIEFDIVLPCYNPHPHWEERVIAQSLFFQQNYPDYHFHIHVVDDGSTRGYDPEVIARLQCTIPDIDIIRYTPNRGKGYAVREGVRHCTAPYILYTDYDFPYTQTSLDRVIQTLLQGASVVVAVRGHSYQSKLSPWRRLLSASSHWINRLLLGLKITDTQGGMKGFDRRGQELFLATTIDTFLFDTQFIRKASRDRSLKLVAVESQIREGIHLSGMGLKVMFRESMNLLKICLDR